MKELSAYGCDKVQPRLLLLALASVALLCLAACAAAADMTESDDASADQVAIYSAVVRRIYTQDDTFGGTLNPPIVYLVSTTDDSIGDPGIEQAGPQAISAGVQQGIVEALADLPAEFIWVEAAAAVPMEADTGAVAGDGVIVMLGNIHQQEDGSALVSGSIFVASLAAGGQTYIAERVDGSWQVTGTTGVHWMS